MNRRFKYGHTFVIRLSRAIELVKGGTALRQQYSLIKVAHEVCAQLKHEFEEEDLINEILTEAGAIMRTVGLDFGETYTFKLQADHHKPIDRLYSLCCEYVDQLPTPVLVPVLHETMFLHRVS